MVARKTVRFAAEDANTSVEFTTSDDARHELLYTKRSEHEANCRSLLEESRSHDSQKYGGRYLDCIFDLPLQEQVKSLLHLHREVENARGLEQKISDDHFRQRRYMRQLLIEAILDQQHTQLKAPMTCDEKAESLASLSEEYSNSARVFARLMAIADEEIAREEHGLQPLVPTDSPVSKGNSQRRTTSGKLAKMVHRIRRSNSIVGSSKLKANRRNSPRAVNDLGSQFERFVSIQQRY